MGKIPSLADLIPPERREELKEEYEKINKEIEKLEAKIATLREKKKKMRKLLIDLGMLEPVSTVPKGQGTKEVREYIMRLEPGTEFTFKEIVENTGVNRGSVWRTVKILEEQGVIERVGRGKYIKKNVEDSGVPSS